MIKFSFTKVWNSNTIVIINGFNANSETEVIYVIINVSMKVWLYLACLDGFYGKHCTKKCEDGAYGQQCGNTCQCPIEQCNHVSGCITGK